MSFKDYILNLISETKLFEMAFDKKTMENKIRGLENPINEHLIKVLCYEDKLNLNKHITDIINWYWQIQKLDFLKNNRKFTKQQYFKLLFTEPITDTDNESYVKITMRQLSRNYGDLKVIRTPKEVLDELERIQLKASDFLSKNSFEELEQLIEELGK